MSSFQSIARRNPAGCLTCVPSTRCRMSSKRALHVRASAATANLPIMVNSCSGKVSDTVDSINECIDWHRRNVLVIIPADSDCRPRDCVCVFCAFFVGHVHG